MCDTLPAERLVEFQSLAQALAQAAAEVILPLFRRGVAVEDKGGPGRGFDPVTAADKGAEAAIRRLLAQQVPSHGVIGEEYGEDRSDSEFVWVLDPIDGTRAFVAGLPLWTTLIALRHHGRPVVGLIAQPFLGEIYVGDAHGSSLITGDATSPLRARACPRLAQAVIATTDAFLFDARESEAWSEVRRRSRLARYGCDAYAFARVAAGDIDLVAEAGLRAWDIEAAMPLIAGAGGVCSDWAGRPIGRNGGQVVVAGDAACLDQALEALQGAAQNAPSTLFEGPPPPFHGGGS